MQQITECESTDRRNLLAIAAVLTSSGVLGLGEARAQAPAAERGGAPHLPQAVYEGSVKRAQKYLHDKQAHADYQKRIAAMLEGFKAGKDPHLLIREVVLSDEDARAKLAPYVNVAGAEGVFSLCMLTVLGTLASAQR
jgi:hypothetical protein